MKFIQKICVITPTIQGRENLLSATIKSIKNQTYKDFIHVACGDGPSKISQEICQKENIIWTEVKKEGKWGFNCRNHVIENYDAEYYMFLDDDNIYNSNCLEEVSKRFPAEFISFKINWVARWLNKRIEIPNNEEVIEGQFDMMNMCVSSKIAKQIKFQPIYEQDFLFANEAYKLAVSNCFINEVLGKYDWSYELKNGK